MKQTQANNTNKADLIEFLKSPVAYVITLDGLKPLKEVKKLWN